MLVMPQYKNYFGYGYGILLGKKEGRVIKNKIKR